MQTIYNELNANRDKLNGEFQKQLNEIKKKMERLEERFINEEINPELYGKFNSMFKQEIWEIEQKIDGCPVSASNLEYYINRSIELATELPSLWASSSFSDKQKLQKLIFSEGIYYNQQKDETRTTKMNSVFLLIAGLQGVTGQKNKGLQNAISLKSLPVARMGIEPRRLGLQLGLAKKCKSATSKAFGKRLQNCT
ncbi:MAG: hypothetical protein NVS3B19_19840 [Ginsengibacter sp.]